MAKSPASKPSLKSQLNQARADLERAEQELKLLADEEDQSLESDEAFTNFLERRSEVDAKITRLIAYVASLEKKAARDEEKATHASLRKRYRDAAAQSLHIKEMILEELPKAWSIIAKVIEATARADIEINEIRRLTPEDFEPPCPLISGDMRARSSPAQEETIIHTELVDLYVYSSNGNPVADQENPPADNAVLRKFKKIEYYEREQVRHAKAFYEELIFPAISADCLPYDGTRVRTPAEAIQRLRNMLPRPREREMLTRFEPVSDFEPSQRSRPNLMSMNRFSGDI